MHELSIATSLVEQVLEIAKLHQAKAVVKLSIDVGELSGVEIEPLEFCFPFAIEGTILENVELEINSIPIRVKCHECGKETTIEIGVHRCADCFSNKIEFVAGKELLIKRVEVV